MRILIVKLKNIGDTLLLTPTIVGVKMNYPSCEIHVVVRRGCEGILTGCSAIDYVHTSAPPGVKKQLFTNILSDVLLVIKLRKLNFDYSFELGHGDRGRLIAGLSGAKQRCVNTYARPLNLLWKFLFNKRLSLNWSNWHQVEMDYKTVSELLKLPEEVPSLSFEKSRVVPWQPGSELTEFIVLHPTARWKRKIISVEKWIDVCKWLLNRIPTIVLSTGPACDEIKYGLKIKEQFGERVIMTKGQTSWAQLAWLLYRAKLFIGVDTAAMHLAASCGCPVVAVFGPTSVKEWHPWKVKHELVLPEESASRSLPPQIVINTITSDKIISACNKIMT